jgi:DNA-binding transcriptional regulator PaaX
MNTGLRKNGRPYQIMKYLALGTGILVLSIISPASGAYLIKAGIKSYIRNKRFEKEKFLRDLKNLQKRELINYEELESGEIKITLTKKGEEKALVYKLDEIKLNKPKKWDGKWRLIMFDIPHFHKKSRDALRAKLNDLKFYPLQKSVFITPYPCEEEIDFIASIFDIRKYILILYVSNFEGEEKLKHHFGV